MKKDINIIKHALVQQFTFPGKGNELAHFSAFRVDFSKQNEEAFDFLKENSRSDFFSVIKVVSGFMKARIDFKPVDIRKDMLFVINPNSIKQLLKISPDCTIEGVSFTSDFIKELKFHENLVDQMEFFTSKYAPLWILKKQESKLFSKLIREMENRLAKLRSHTYGMELLVNSFSGFLFEMAEIGKNRDISVSMPYGRKEDLVIKFTRLVMEHHLNERTLSFYSHKLFVTSKHLSETTKEITGKTAGQIIDEFNIREAKRLLESTELSIAEIAYRLQFSNPAFFSKFFSRLNGLSPRAYRTSLNKARFGKIKPA